MNKKYVSFDYSQIEAYLHKFEELRPRVEQVINNVLNEWGIIFLNKVTDNIIECKSVVTSNMIASFTFGDTNSIWEVDKNSITVGSKVRYAYLVENGHWNMGENVTHRFIPGYWKSGDTGDKFVYDPTAKGGMMLKLQYIEGKKFFAKALLEMEGQIGEIFDSYMAELLDIF